MREYLVKSKPDDKEWQIKNQARDHVFICDDAGDDHNAGPNPVEYLCGSVNSCIVMSAGMIAKSHQLDVKNFQVENHAQTEKLGHGKSVVTEMEITVSFDSKMNKDERADFLSHVLHVSTVYQTLKEAVKIYVELA